MFSHCLVGAWETEMHSALKPEICSDAKAGGCKLVTVHIATNYFFREIKQPLRLLWRLLKPDRWGELILWFLIGLNVPHILKVIAKHNLSPHPLNIR